VRRRTSTRPYPRVSSTPGTAGCGPPGRVFRSRVPNTRPRSRHGSRSGQGSSWTVTTSALHPYVCNGTPATAGAGRRRLAGHTKRRPPGENYGTRPSTASRSRAPSGGSATTKARSHCTNEPVETAPLRGRRIHDPETCSLATNGGCEGRTRRFEPREALSWWASTQENFALISMTFAERLTTSGSSSSNRSPCILLVGPEMLTAPRTSASLSTGAATHLSPSIFSSSSIA